MTAEKLYRKRINKVFGGVASGLADYLNLDPVLIRVLFIILAFVNGIGLLLYIILWIVIPEDTTIYSYAGTSNKSTVDDSQFEESNSKEEKKPNFTMPERPNSNGRVVFGSILIGIGVIFLAERFIPVFDFFDFLPVLFIALGVVLIINAQTNKGLK